MEPIIDDQSIFHNDDVTLTANDDSIRDLLWDLKISSNFEFPGFYKDTFDGKYIKLIMMEEDEAIERLRRVDKEKRHGFIRDSLITTIELFPEKKKLNYSYDEIIKLKYLGCDDKNREYGYYFKNDSIAKSKYIKSLQENKQIVLGLNFINEHFSVPDIDVYILDNIEVSLQNFNNRKWITSDTLQIDIENFALDCFQIVDYKHDDFVLVLFSGSNVGMIHFKHEYLVKIDIDKDRIPKYEILTFGND